MRKEEDLLQERLERLEAGEPLEVCQADISEDVSALLGLANQLRAIEWPERDKKTAVSQRAKLLTLAIQEGKMGTQKKSVIRWLRDWRLPLAISGVVVMVFACALVAALGAGAIWWSSRKTPEPQQAIFPPPVTPSLPPNTIFLPRVASERALTPQEAKLQAIQGLVEIRDQANAWTPIQASHFVTAGQRIRTGALSSVQVTFYDGSQAQLGPNTEISIDELEAHTGDEPRVIALTQWIGESEHQVASTSAGGSRYEVHTPSAAGVAKGTLFHVLVTPDRLTRFSVEEGALAVTGMEATVTVEAGEVTTVNAGESPGEPAFRITGEGVVSQTGDTWIIAGQLFTTYTNTIIIGAPQVGDWVFVEGRLLPDDTRIADLIVLLRRSPMNRFRLTGEVEVIADTTWTVAGQTVVITDTTEIDDDIGIGDLVQVEGVILEGGTLQAEQIRRLEGELGLPFDFTGVVQEIGDQAWIISGITIAVDDETTVDAGLTLGDIVRVRGWIQEDGTWLARSIERVLDERRAFEFTGRIESIDPWRVAGITFETREWTEIEEGLDVGDEVRVKGQIMEDGTWVAFEIERLDDEAALRIVLVGIVTSIDPWVVNGIPLVVDEETIIEDGIAVGTLVRVEIHLLPDGTWQVVEIKSLQGIGWNLGCMNLTAIVVSVSGNQIQLLNWPLITLGDDVVIVGELAPNSVVQFQICYGTGMNIYIVYIVVIIPAEPEVAPVPQPSPPPAGEGDKVTICHKPNSKNPHTITISRSALPAHLAHGDTIGPCP